MKPGITTTEFWVTALTTLFGGAGLATAGATGAAPTGDLMQSGMALVALVISYVLSRAHVKASAVKSGAAEAQAAADQLATDVVTGSQVVKP